MLNWHVFALEKMRIQLWFRSRICLLLLFFWCICFDLFICENLKKLRRTPWMRRICVILSIGNLWNIFGLVACLSRYFEKLLRFSDIFGVFFAGVFQALYILQVFSARCAAILLVPVDKCSSIFYDLRYILNLSWKISVWISQEFHHLSG